MARNWQPPRKGQAARHGGGVGAGKSKALDDEVRREYNLVIDGTLRDQLWASSVLQDAFKNGWETTVSYVQRPMVAVADGVISRSNETGRKFPLRHLFSSHRDAQSSFLALSKELSLHPAVEFTAYYTSGPVQSSKPEIVKMSQIDAGGLLSYSYRYDDRRRKKDMEGRRQEGDAELIETSERRGISEAFERAVRGGKIEERILRLLARKDEGLEKILSDHGILKGTGGSSSDEKTVRKGESHDLTGNEFDSRIDELLGESAVHAEKVISEKLVGYQNGSLTDIQARDLYNRGQSWSNELMAQMEADNIDLERRAMAAFQMREILRTKVRNLMANRELAQKLDREHPPYSWDIIYTKYNGDYNAIIGGSRRTNDQVNKIIEQRRKEGQK